MMWHQITERKEKHCWVNENVMSAYENKNTISRKKKERINKYSFWQNKQTLKECSMYRHL